MKYIMQFFEKLSEGIAGNINNDCSEIRMRMFRDEGRGRQLEG